MIEIKRKQRWLFDNLQKTCSNRTHFKSKVIFEITHVFSPKSKISDGCIAKGKVIQTFSDRTFKTYPEWGLEKDELDNSTCTCYQYLTGQDKA